MVVNLRTISLTTDDVKVSNESEIYESDSAEVVLSIPRHIFHSFETISGSLVSTLIIGISALFPTIVALITRFLLTVESQWLGAIVKKNEPLC